MMLAVETTLPLSLEQLENSQPLVAEFAQLLVYPEVNMAFLDGEPFHISAVEDIYLTLVAACAAVYTQTPQKRSWDTPLGVVEVEPHSFNIQINGIAHTPGTVDRYSQDLQQAIAAVTTRH